MKIKFLLVDDDSDDRELFCDALKEEDPSVECECAANPDEAYNILAATSVLPDVVFLDINMSLVNGWKCLTALKQSNRLKHLPVIIYSTSSYPRDKGIARDLGALSYVTKPDSIERLKAVLREIIKHTRQNTLSSLTVE